MISMFICEDGDVTTKTSKCEQILARFTQLSSNNDDPNILLKYIEPDTLMRFYLPACDIY